MLAGVAWGAGQHMADIEPQSNIPIALHVSTPACKHPQVLRANAIEVVVDMWAHLCVLQYDAKI